MGWIDSSSNSRYFDHIQAYDRSFAFDLLVHRDLVSPHAKVQIHSSKGIEVLPINSFHLFDGKALEIIGDQTMEVGWARISISKYTSLI